MRRRRIFVSLMVMVLLGLAALTVYGETTIKIGAIGPLTGESSIGGLDELNGKKMAVDDFNAAGGLAGRQVELFSEDDASQPSQSAAAATKLINQNKVVALCGAHNSACTLAVMEVLTRYKIPMVTPGSSSPAVTASGNEWIARSFPGDVIQAGALVNFVKNVKKISKIGIIYVNDDFGKGGYNAVKAATEKLGGISVVAAESFMGEDKDMKTQLTKIRQAGVEGLFIWCQYTPGALIMKQAREMNWNVQFYGSTGIVHQKTFELSTGAYNGTINSVPWIPNVPDQKVQDWVKRYVAKFGKDPSQNSARAYDGMMLLLNAMKTANSTEPAAIRDAVRNTKNYDGLQGKITIDSKTGEYVGEVFIVQAENGGWNFLAKAAGL